MMTAKLLLAATLALCGASRPHRLLQNVGEVDEENGPEPPPVIDDPATDDDAAPPCSSPAGCPCIYGAVDTFVAFDDDSGPPEAQPQKGKRPHFLADVTYPIRGAIDRISVSVFMNGATTLDGFTAETAGTGTHQRKNKVVSPPANSTEDGTAMYKLKFPPSTGIRTRTWRYELVDSTGTCPTSYIRKKANVYPIWMPFMPVLVLLALSVITQDVFISMSAGCVVARWMIERDLWIGILRFLDTDLPAGLSNMNYVILFSWLLGGVIGAANRSGGMAALAPIAINYIKDSMLSQLVVFCFGFVVFFDDYGNTLIVGNSIRPITDYMRLSREKLSFLVDCTSAPIASLMPISTWVAFEVDRIDQALNSIGYDDESAYNLFLDSIPKRFYAWFMLAMVLGCIFLSRDWGPMYAAELRARRGDGVAPQDPNFDEKAAEDIAGGVPPKKGIPHRWYNAFLPFFGLVAAFIPLLFYSGARQSPYGGVGWDASSRRIIGNADSYGVLIWVGTFAIVLEIVLYAVQYSKEWGGCLLTPSETIQAAIEGTKDLVECSIVLILANSIGSLIEYMMLPDALVSVLGESIPGKALPSVIFVTAAFIALATGSSWATMTIIFPIAMPLADLASGSKKQILTQTIAAVLGGATFGDHCSPISDTTVLSAAACRVRTIEHVKTQLPYAFMAGSCACILGFLLHGYGVPDWVLIIGGFAFMPGIFFGMSKLFEMFGKGGDTPIYDPEHDKVVGAGPSGTVKSIKRNCTCGRVAVDDDDEPVKSIDMVKMDADAKDAPDV